MATAGPSSPPPAAVHGRGRRNLLVLLMAVAGVVVLFHAVGGTAMAGIGIGLAGFVVLVLLVWKFPKIWRHLHPAGKDQWHRRSRTGSLNYPGQKGRGLPSIRARRHGPPGSTMSRRHRPAMAPFRQRGGAGLRAGTRGHRGLVPAGRRRPAGTAARRGGGAGVAAAGGRRRAGEPPRTPARLRPPAAATPAPPPLRAAVPAGRRRPAGTSPR